MQYSQLEEDSNSLSLTVSDDNADLDSSSSQHNQKKKSSSKSIRSKVTKAVLGKSKSTSNTSLSEPLTGGSNDNGNINSSNPDGQDLEMNGEMKSMSQDELMDGTENNNNDDTGNNNMSKPSEDDPFYVFKDDLIRKLDIMDDTLASYLLIVRTTDTAVNTQELKDTKKQLKRHIKNSESTLKDLQTTIHLVERQRVKFSLFITTEELMARKEFIVSSQSKIYQTKNAMNSSEVKQKIIEDERALACRRMSLKNNNGGDSNGMQEDEENLVNQTANAHLILKQQDETLDELDDAVVRVGTMADTIHTEIKHQTYMLDDLEADLQDAEEKLGFVMGKLGKFLKTKNRCQLGTILCLMLIVLVLFFLVLYT